MFELIVRRLTTFPLANNLLRTEFVIYSNVEYTEQNMIYPQEESRKDEERCRVDPLLNQSALFAGWDLRNGTDDSYDQFSDSIITQFVLV